MSKGTNPLLDKILELTLAELLAMVEMCQTNNVTKTPQEKAQYVDTQLQMFLKTVQDCLDDNRYVQPDSLVTLSLTEGNGQSIYRITVKPLYGQVFPMFLECIGSWYMLHPSSAATVYTFGDDLKILSD